MALTLSTESKNLPTNRDPGRARSNPKKTSEKAAVDLLCRITLLTPKSIESYLPSSSPIPPQIFALCKRIGLTKLSDISARNPDHTAESLYISVVGHGRPKGLPY
jgi:hypothetical protein